MGRTLPGEAAADLADAQSKRQQAEQFARDPLMSRKMRRIWRHDAHRWTDLEAEAQAAFDRTAGPILARPDTTTRNVEAQLDFLRDLGTHRDDWLTAHPEAQRRIDDLDRQLRRLQQETRLSANMSHPIERELHQPLGPLVEAESRAAPEIDLGL
jgi:hypothetical protein